MNTCDASKCVTALLLGLAVTAVRGEDAAALADARPLRAYKPDAGGNVSVAINGTFQWDKQLLMEQQLCGHLHGRLSHMLRSSTSEECRTEVSKAFWAYMLAVLAETPLPFEMTVFENQCPVSDPLGVQQGASASSRAPGAARAESDTKSAGSGGVSRTLETDSSAKDADSSSAAGAGAAAVGVGDGEGFQTDAGQMEGFISAQDMRLAYFIMVHENATQVERLIGALREPGRGHSFTIHVDGKDGESGQTITRLRALEAASGDVDIMSEGRMNVSWGGFNMVQATLNGIKHILDSDRPFDWIVTLSGATYPLWPNEAIRKRLAAYPASSIFIELNPRAHVPAPPAWHYYVECDNSLHRIGRNIQPRGIEMHVGSQWFILPPKFARWLTTDKKLVSKYADYAKHVVVADENFFSTIAMSSPFCRDIVRKNYLHVQFDKYEHAKVATERRDDKCLVPNPNHCGRSPTVMTTDYLPVLEHSGALFARKFDPSIDAAVLDWLDEFRSSPADNENRLGWGYGAYFTEVRISPLGSGAASNGKGEGGGEKDGARSWRSFFSAGGGSRSGANSETVSTVTAVSESLCLTLRPMVAAASGPPPAMAVTLEQCAETNTYQSLQIGTCSSDGALELQSGGGTMQSTRGRHFLAACPVKAPSANACLDIEREQTTPGARLVSYRCSNRWNQLFAFGEAKLAGHIFNNVPAHYPDSRAVGGRLCIEVVETQPPSGPQLRTAVCDEEKAAQKFVVVPWHEDGLESCDVEPPNN